MSPRYWLCLFVLVILLACGQQTPVSTAIPEATATPVATPVPSATHSPEPSVAPKATSTAVFTPFPALTAVPTRTAEPTDSPTPTAVTFNPSPLPTTTHTAVPTSTAAPRPTATHTPSPTSTPVPLVLLSLDVESNVTGYRSDGTADVTLDLTLLNEGGRPIETVQQVKLYCPDGSQGLSGCDEVVGITLTDGFGPASGSLSLRIPMGAPVAVTLDYGSHEPMTVEVKAPERILGIERDLFDCYADREPVPDPAGGLLYGCFGWGDTTVAKWLNDAPVKVWATGDPSYIEDFRNVLTRLSPVLGLDFGWVDSEHEADLRGYMGVHREDIAQLGFQHHTVDYGGFADSSRAAGEATSGYVVVWYTDETPPTGITLHETLHALVPISHTTRPSSAVGGSGMALMSPRDKALFRLNSHPLVRPGMTLREVEQLIVFRDELLDGPAPEPITDPMRMLWNALVSLDESGTAGYKLSGGRIDRQCGQTFGIRRGPLEFRMGRFRVWRDDPALVYFHDHTNEFYLFWSASHGEWKRYYRPLDGTEWRFVTWHQMLDLTNWWNWIGKLHKTIRSVLQDAESDDITVERTHDGELTLSITLDESFAHMGFWNSDTRPHRVNSVDFSLTLNPETFAIRGYRWTLHDNPEAYPGSPCLTYEEVATDFEVGVEIEQPDDIPE